MVSGSYESMAHFELFAAHAMIYFAIVSYAEVSQRVHGSDTAAWSGFLGVDDPAIMSVPSAAARRLRRITRGDGHIGTPDERREFAAWVRSAIAPRNVAGLAEPRRHHLYPVDLDTLIERHALLNLSREQLVAALPALRGTPTAPELPHPLAPATR